MALTDNLEKTRDDIRKTLEDRTPLLAITGFGDLAVAKLRDASAELSARAEKFDAKALPEKAQELVGDTVATALVAYNELAVRGQQLVNRVRGQQATVAAEEQVAATVAKVKAVKTTAKKSATATKKSATATRTTAKKSAVKTKTATKSAATSAKKSATATKKATTSAASKVGN